MRRLTVIFLSLFTLSIISVSVQGSLGVQAAPQRLPPKSEAGHVFHKEVHYKEIEGGKSIYQGEQVDVLELLWYGCKTCYLIQDDLEQWVASAGKTITYRRMPAVTEDHMMLLARAFYTAEVLGVMAKTHKPLFAAIHESSRKLQSEQEVGEFFLEQGVAAKDFKRAMSSAYVNGKLRRARIMSQRYGIQGAPSIIIDGQYLVDPSMVRSPREFIEVVGFLVGKVRSTVRSR